MGRVRAAAVLVVALVVQAAFVAELELFGAHGEVLLLVPIVVGLSVGPERGAVAGFAAGFAVDLLVQTPFGLTALTYCLVGYAVGALQSGVLRASWWLPALSAIAGSAAGIVLFASLAAVVGEQGAFEDLPSVVAAVVVWNAMLVAPGLRLARWVERVNDRRMLA